MNSSTCTAYTIIINVHEDHVAACRHTIVRVTRSLFDQRASFGINTYIYGIIVRRYIRDILSNTCRYSTWVRSSLYMPFPAFDSQYALGYRNTCTRMKILLKIHLCWIHSAGPSSAVLVQRR